MFSLFADRVAVTRRTPTLRATAAAATSMDLDRQPDGAVYLSGVVSSGTTNAGEITVTGTDRDGNAISDRLVFTNALPRAQTVLSFASVTGITSADLVADGASLELTGVDSGGSPVSVGYSLVTNWPCHIEHGPGDWGPGREGTAAKEPTWVGFPVMDGYSPRQGDELVDQYGRRWLVQTVPQHRWSAGESHIECEVIERDRP